MGRTAVLELCIRGPVKWKCRSLCRLRLSRDACGRGSASLGDMGWGRGHTDAGAGWTRVENITYEYCD